MNLLQKLSYRHINLVLLLVPAGLLAFGYYLQFIEGLEPCPLCMTQRIAFYGIAIIALLAIITPQRLFWQHFLAALSALVALVGAGVASRQLWLQSLPEDQVPACGPGFDFIIDTFPLSEAIAIMFRGTGSCAEVAWTFLGLSIPGWALLAFCSFFILATIQLFKK